MTIALGVSGHNGAMPARSPVRSPPDLPRWPGAAGVMARSSQENFPVASRLLPAALRAHLLAIYGFARLTDELGDELRGDRLAALDWLEADLDRAYAGMPTHPLMVRLSATLAARELPREPFVRLIEANRVDQRVSRYETFEQLLDYCALSANPVGELVLGVLGLATAERVALSDSICSGLQLAEHWQDVGEDLSRGRIYLPTQDMRRFGLAERDLGANHADSRVRELMALEVARARELLARGVPLLETLPVRAMLAVAGFISGGFAALEAITRADYDVLGAAPRASRPRRLLTFSGLALSELGEKWRQQRGSAGSRGASRVSDGSR
jgi:squalene synthase HpnC